MKMTEMFEKAPIRRVYFNLAMPVVASMVAAMVYNLADTFFVAKTNDAAMLAAVTLGTPLFTFLIAVGDIFGLGAASAISRRLGQHDYDASLRLSCFSFYFAAGFSVIVTALMILFKTPAIKMLGATSATWQQTDGFYSVLAFGAITIVWSLVPTSTIRTEGMAGKAMFATFCGVAVSLVLDPVFIFWLKWGAAGIAWANVLGYLAEDVVLIYIVLRSCHYQSFNLKYCHISLEEFVDIIKIGVPSSLANIMLMIATATYNHMLAGYGTLAVATSGIAIRIYQIVVMVQIGFAFGAQPLLGYNFGARNWQRLKEAIKFDLVVEVGYSFVGAILLILSAHSLIGIFMDTPAVQKLGFWMLFMLLISSPAVGVMYVATTFFQSTGQGTITMFLTVLRQGLLYLPTIYLLDAQFGLWGIMVTQPITDVIAALLGGGLLWYFFKKNKGQDDERRMSASNFN